MPDIGCSDYLKEINYTSITEAKEACNVNPLCQAVYDIGNNETNTIYLVPMDTPYNKEESSMIYEKGKLCYCLAKLEMKRPKIETK